MFYLYSPFEVQQRSVKIKILVNVYFNALSKIHGAGRVISVIIKDRIQKGNGY